MRKIEFCELKLKNINNEETFYYTYLKNLHDSVKEDKMLQIPEKQYEIFLLNILGGKLILLNTDFITNKDFNGAELFFNYSIALKVYNLLLDIIDGIEDEKNEFNELYKDERLKKNKEIEQLKKQDDKLFKNRQIEYNTIINSYIYKEYLEIKEENKQLRLENERLKEKIKINNREQNDNIGFFQKLVNRFNNKRLPKN